MVAADLCNVKRDASERRVFCCNVAHGGNQIQQRSLRKFPGRHARKQRAYQSHSECWELLTGYLAYAPNDLVPMDLRTFRDGLNLIV